MDCRVPSVPTAYIVHVRGYCGHILYDTGIHPCLELEVISLGVALITYLCGKVGVAACSIHQKLRFVECAGQWFLHIYVLALVEGEHAYGEVRVVGCGYGYGVESVAGLVEHLSKVAETARLGVFVHYRLGVWGAHVYIAESHDIDHACSLEIADNLFAAVSDSHICYFYLFGAFGLGFLCFCRSTEHRRAAYRHSGGSQTHGSQKISSGGHVI